MALVLIFIVVIQIPDNSYKTNTCFFSSFSHSYHFSFFRRKNIRSLLLVECNFGGSDYAGKNREERTKKDFTDLR